MCNKWPPNITPVAGKECNILKDLHTECGSHSSQREGEDQEMKTSEKAQFCRDFLNLIDKRQIVAHRRCLKNPQFNALNETEAALLAQMQLDPKIYSEYENVRGLIAGISSDEVYMQGLRDGMILADILKSDQSFNDLTEFIYSVE